jgi:hypothetical protein
MAMMLLVVDHLHHPLGLFEIHDEQVATGLDERAQGGGDLDDVAKVVKSLAALRERSRSCANVYHDTRTKTTSYVAPLSSADEAVMSGTTMPWKSALSRPFSLACTSQAQLVPVRSHDLYVPDCRTCVRTLSCVADDFGARALLDHVRARIGADDALDMLGEAEGDEARSASEVEADRRARVEDMGAEEGIDDEAAQIRGALGFAILLGLCSVVVLAIRGEVVVRVRVRAMRVRVRAVRVLLGHDLEDRESKHARTRAGVVRHRRSSAAVRVLTARSQRR